MWLLTRRCMTVRVDRALRKEFLAEVAASDRHTRSDAAAEAMRDWVHKRREMPPPKPRYVEKGALAQFTFLNMIGSQFSA